MEKYESFITACIFMFVILSGLIGLIISQYKNINRGKRERKRIEDIINNKTND
jgi:hypothetical protein